MKVEKACMPEIFNITKVKNFGKDGQDIINKGVLGMFKKYSSKDLVVMSLFSNFVPRI
jgi:hypothetical protein